MRTSFHHTCFRRALLFRIVDTSVRGDRQAPRRALDFKSVNTSVRMGLSASRGLP